MPLPDENTGVMNRLGHTRLEHNSLKTTLEKILHGQRQDVIELVLALVEQPVPVHLPEKRLSFEDPLGVLLVERQEIPRGVTDAAQGVLDSPELTLVAETVLADELQLGVETLLLERTTWALECFSIYYTNTHSKINKTLSNITTHLRNGSVIL